MFPQIENSQLTSYTNQLTDLYMIRVLVMNGLTHFWPMFLFYTPSKHLKTFGLIVTTNVIFDWQYIYSAFIRKDITQITYEKRPQQLQQQNHKNKHDNRDSII